MAIREAAISSERELRAYILIEQVEMIELLPQKPYRIKIRAVNFGQTPAKNFRLVWGSDIVSTEIINDIDYTVPEIAIGSRSILGPDDDNFAFVESRMYGARFGTKTSSESADGRPSDTDAQANKTLAAGRAAFAHFPTATTTHKTATASAANLRIVV